VISDNKREDLEEFTLSSDIKEDYLDTQQDILPLEQVCSDMTIYTTRVPLPKQQSCTDTVIAHSILPTL
jgi:hypothetical protein